MLAQGESLPKASETLGRQDKHTQHWQLQRSFPCQFFDERRGRIQLAQCFQHRF